MQLKRAAAGPISGTRPDVPSLECRGVSGGAPSAGSGGRLERFSGLSDVQEHSPWSAE